MKPNMASFERTFRALLGIVLIVIFFVVTMSTALKYILLVVGIMMLVTSMTGFCGLYKLIGFSTIRKK